VVPSSPGIILRKNAAPKKVLWKFSPQMRIVSIIGEPNHFNFHDQTSTDWGFVWLRWQWRDWWVDRCSSNRDQLFWHGIMGKWPFLERRSLTLTGTRFLCLVITIIDIVVVYIFEEVEGIRIRHGMQHPLVVQILIAWCYYR
jgi:hypothetical protein